METLGREKFSSAQEEIAFLRNEIARRERELLSRNSEVDRHDIEPARAVGPVVYREVLGGHACDPPLLGGRDTFCSTAKLSIGARLDFHEHQRIAVERGRSMTELCEMFRMGRTQMYATLKTNNLYEKYQQMKRHRKTKGEQ